MKTTKDIIFILVFLAIFGLIVGYSIKSFSEESDYISAASAHVLCAALDSTGVLSKKCEVSGWDRSVNISATISAVTARQVCNQWSDSGLYFDPEWTLKITSPYANSSIAECSL